MKLVSTVILLFLSYHFSIAGGSCTFTANVNATVNNATCNGSSNGSITIAVTGGNPYQTSNKGLLISEYLTNPSGNDSPFEFVELIATKTIDFSVTPYTVIFTNNGVATTNGWVNGGSISYAFEITTGTVQAGDVVYVGGSSMVPTGNKIRVINTVTTAGDGGIGNIDASANGVLGNGTANADGIAVFDIAVNLLTSNSVPVDAIFFGDGLGSAVVSGGSAGYQLPVNDVYNGGKLQGNSFFVAGAGTGQSTKAIGAYNVRNNTFSLTRVWVNSAYNNNNASDVNIEGLYDFTWSNGATTQNIANIPAGNYSVSIIDASFCVSTNHQFAVSQYDVAQAIPTVNNVLCFGDNTGEISITPLGGSPNPIRNYTWSNGSTTTNLVGLVAGNYCYTVSDVDGCTTSGCVDVLQPNDSIKITALNIDSTSCFGSGDGSIDIQVSGGFPGYSVFWSNNVSGVFSNVNLLAGNYTVTVEDNNLCTKTKTFTVLQPDSFKVNFIFKTDVKCFGGNDGTIDVGISGGTGFYTFQWNNNISSTSNFIEILEAGNYQATVIDEAGCAFSFNAGTINQPDELVASTSNVIFESCAGVSADGVYEVAVSGGVQPYIYNWSNSEQGNDNFIDSLSAAGFYAVTVTDDNGCTTTTSTNFGFLSNLSVTEDNVTDASSCAASDGAISISVNGESDTPTFTWSNASTTEDLNGLSAGNYSVTVSDGDCTVSLEDILVECSVSVQDIAPASIYIASIANNQLLLKVSETHVTTQVYALDGSLVATTKLYQSKEANIDVNNWAHGTYLVKFTDATGNYRVKKVVR